jgi:hypothetical protein
MITALLVLEEGLPLTSAIKHYLIVAVVEMVLPSGQKTDSLWRPESAAQPSPVFMALSGGSHYSSRSESLYITSKHWIVLIAAWRNTQYY